MHHGTCVCLLHHRKDCPGAIKDAVEVEINDSVPVLELNSLDSFIGTHRTSIVKQDVDSALFTNHTLHQRIPLLELCHIHVHAVDSLLGKLILVREVKGIDRGAFLGKQLHSCPANSPSATGNNRHLVG